MKGGGKKTFATPIPSEPAGAPHMQSYSASDQPAEDAGDFTVVQYKKNLRTNTQKMKLKGAQLKANKEEPPASRHGSQLKGAPPLTPLWAPQPVPLQDDQLEDSAGPPEPIQQPKLQESQQTSAASGSSPPSQQHLQGPAELPQALQQPETQPSSAAAGASEPAQRPRPAGVTPGHQRYWREPWQACYYTHQQKVAMGLQLFWPVARPRGGRPGRGGGMSMHPSWQLHFTTWEVQRAFVDARRDGHAGRYAEAREKMHKVHELETWNTRIIVDLAELCVALESFEQANAWASFAIGLDSSNALAYQWRARARKGYGFLAGARSDWQNALLHASADKAAMIEEELRKVMELAANTSDAEQETARQCSHRFDGDIARDVWHAKAARAVHLAQEEAHATARRDRLAPEKGIREGEQVKRFRAKIQETHKTWIEQKAARADQGRGCVTIPVDARTGPSDTSFGEEQDKRKGKEPLSHMCADMAQEAQHCQAASQALSAICAGRSNSSASGLQLENAEAADALLSMSPQFVHDLQPGDIKSVLASIGTAQKRISRKDLERVVLEGDVEIYYPAQHGTEPEQDQASGQSGSQQEASGKKADDSKPTGGSNKKKKNRKKGLHKAVQVEQVTARGIMEVPPTPEGPPAAEDPLPAPGRAEPNSPVSVAAAPVVSNAAPEASLDLAERIAQPQPGADASADDRPPGAPGKAEEPEQAQDVPVTKPEMLSGPGFSTRDVEQFERLQIGVPTEPEEELFHDAGSGFESAAQLGSTGTRRSSLDSDLAWPQYSSTGTDSGPKTPEEDPEQQYQEAQEALLTSLGSVSGLDAQDVGSPELRSRVQLAQEALDRKDYKAALNLCKEAEWMEGMCLEPLGIKAQANLQLGNFKMCIATYQFIAKHQEEMSSEDRMQRFDHASRSAEQLLSNGSLAGVRHAKELLLVLKDLQCCTKHEAKVAFLGSYARLRQYGVFTHLEHFLYSPNMSKQDADHLISEVHALLEVDEAVLDAMMAMSEPSFMAYRKVMAEAAREAGNLCNKWENCPAALERYTLALMLDANNLSARCNRARVHLAINNPEAAIEDATAVIAATEGRATQGSKQHQRLLEKALKRRGKAYYHLGCKTGRPQYYLRAHEDFNSINSTEAEVIDLMSLCHGLVLQNGGAEEVAALDSAFPSKTRAAPPSRQALAAMGEDGSGLSVEEMLRSISRPRAIPSADPLGNGAPRTLGGALEQLADDALLREVAAFADGAQMEAEEAQHLQQSKQAEPPLSCTTGPSSSRSRLSHVTGKPKGSAFSYSHAVKAGKAKQAAPRSSEEINFPGPMGFVLKFTNPGPATQGAAAAAASGASSSAEAGSGSAGSRAVPKKAAQAGPAQSNQEREPIQLPAYEALLIRSAAVGHKLMQDLAAIRAQTGCPGWQFTGEELSEYADCLSEGPEQYPRKLLEAVKQRFEKIMLRADQLGDEGRLQAAAQLLDGVARVTGELNAYMMAATACMLAQMDTESVACAEAALAKNPRNLDALSHMAVVYKSQRCHEKLAETCTEILKCSSQLCGVRELRALANHAAGHMVLFRRVRLAGSDDRLAPEVVPLQSLQHAPSKEFCSHAAGVMLLNRQ